MAKKTKKELTPEEKLEAALVPVEEWPYKVPENWCWTYLSRVLETSKEKTDSFTDHKIKYVGLEHIQTGSGIMSYGKGDAVKSTKNIFHPGQILYGKLRPYLNKHDIASFGGICSTDILVFDTMETANAKYVNLYLDHQLFIEYAISHSKGINLPRVSEAVLMEALFPLPLIQEQQRIVDRIESLFTKLDEAKEAVQAVIDGFEERKAAILHKAFSGELTAEWRKGRDCFRKTVSIKSVCSSLKYGTSSKSIPVGKVAVIRMGNLQGGEIDWTNLVYSDNEDDNEKYRLVSGDVLFNRTNSPEHVGKTSIFRGEYPAIYAGYLIKLDYDRDVVIGEYLNYILNSPEAKEYCNQVKTDAVNQSNINAQKIGAFEFPLVGMDEQQSVVDAVHAVIDKEKTVKEAAESVIDQIDTMKKAILARAFRGELGTNDPNDEHAVELLKRILEPETA